MNVRFVAIGDTCVSAVFDDRIDPSINARCVAIAEALDRHPPNGVRDVVPTFNTVAVHFDSARTDQAGRFSRDGTRVAFTSDRTGVPQVWVSNRAGSDLMRLPATEGLSVSVGAWSPDGRSLVFEQAVGNTSQI